MNKILALREKRANLWNETKAFLDSHRGEDGMISAEDNATYEKMEADVVALGKEIERLERQAAIDRELDQPTASPLVSRPTAPTDRKQGRASDEYRNAFWGMIRSRTAAPSVMNALQIGTDTEGGFLVPDEYERTLVQALEEENVLRSLCTIIHTSSGDRKIPVVASHGTASWVDEEGTIPESDEVFGQITIGAHKVATMIKVSDELLQDSVFNIESYIAAEFARRIGAAEEDAFINGDGTGKPTGLLHATNGAGTGVTTAGATIAADEIIDLVHSIKSVYRKKATFLMNDSTIKAIRKLKSIEGQYLWQPGLKEGQPDMLLNYRIVTSPYMPEVAAGKKVILFGDFKQNEGEVPQYYVKGNHEAIIQPDEFEQVQAELARRKRSGRTFSGNSVFASRLICGDCGGYYGQKVWHSNDPYRKVIWRCNRKYGKGQRCSTPTLSEDAIKALFVKAYNMLLGNKETVIEDCETLVAMLEDTAALDTKIAATQEEIDTVVELNKALIREHAAIGMEQTVFDRKAKELDERFRKADAKLNRLKAEKQDRLMRVCSVKKYVENLRGQAGPIEVWNEQAWYLLVTQVTIHADGSAEFLFRGENRITVK